MNNRCRLWALAGAVVACSPSFAFETYATYDGFDVAPIDAGRWLDLERSRHIVGDALILVQRDGGRTDSDSGRDGLSWGNSISRPGPVTQLRATVRVNGVSATGCAANPSPTRVRARLLGTFFNTGNRLAGSYVGDVLAQVYIYRDSNSADAAGVLKIEGSALMCTSSDCNSSTLLASPVSLGTVNVGQNVVLQMEWDRANTRFVFTRDSGTAGVSSGSVAYALDDTAIPGFPLMSVGNRTDVARCMSGPRAFGFVDARYDNVWVNSKAKP